MRRFLGKYAAAAILILFLFSCAKQAKPPARPTEQPQKQEIEQTMPATPVVKTPESSASTRLIEQGKSNYNAGQYQKAMQSLEAAVNLEPDNGEAYYWLSRSNLALDDKDNAKQYLDTARSYLSDDDWLQKLDELQKEIEGGF